MESMIEAHCKQLKSAVPFTKDTKILKLRPMNNFSGNFSKGNWKPGNRTQNRLLKGYNFDVIKTFQGPPGTKSKPPSISSEDIKCKFVEQRQT